MSDKNNQYKLKLKIPTIACGKVVMTKTAEDQILSANL